MTHRSDPSPALLARWLAHVGPAVGRRAAAAALTALARRYHEAARAYHTLEHVLAVLDTVDRLAPLADDLQAVRLAAWFHDAIYVPGAEPGRNEARSATYARWTLRGLGLPGATVAEVARLIHLTATHRAAPHDANGALLLDADLAILGAPWPAYKAYAKAIREEYRLVPVEVYAEGRADLLRRFLARPAIYHTGAMHAEREAAARRNLARELAVLEEGERS